MNKFIPPLSAFLLASLVFLTVPALAATGDLDLSFGTGGKVTTAIGSSGEGYCVGVQSDGKILVAGVARDGSGGDFALVRYNADGTLDTNFNGPGKVTTDFGSQFDGGLGMAVQSDGKIVVVGYTYAAGNQDFAVARYNPDGSLDSTFNAMGKVVIAFSSGPDQGNSVAVDSDGKILVAGISGSGTTQDFGLIRFNPNGSLDSSFNGNGKVTTDFGGTADNAFGVALQSDGKIVVTGSVTDAGGDRLAAARYNADGSLDVTFGGTGKVTTPLATSRYPGNSVALQSDGKIVVAGYYHNGMTVDFVLVRYNANGSPDTSLGGTGRVTTDFGGNSDSGASVAVQNDGKILFAGTAGIGSGNDFALVRYDSNGSLDTTFRGTGKVTTDFGGNGDEGHSVVLQSDGRIVVAGQSTSGSASMFAVARYENLKLAGLSSQTVNRGSPVTLSITATGLNSALTYQWRKDGLNIPGATASSYSVPSAQPWHVGEYTVVVMDSSGIQTLAAATLTINGVPSEVWRGLIAYYPFDGDTLDRGLWESHATLSGAFLTADRMGQPNRAYDFDGLDDQMTAVIPNLPVGNAPRTLSLWAKARPDASRNVSLAQWGVEQNGRAFGLANANAPYTWTGETFGTGPRVNSGGTVDAKWHHLCLTYNGSTLAIYLDGALRQTQAGAIDTALSALFLGAGVAGSGYYPGSLDEVRIYNRALSPSEVQQLKASEDPDSDGDGILDRFETGTGIYVSPEDTGTSRTNSDTDGDGLTDGHEVFIYLSNPTVLDTDGDGFGDGFEVSTGFSPTSAASTPDAFSYALPAIEYRFNAANGVSYRIEASTDLANWSTIETGIVGAGGVVTRFYSTEGQARRFFRSRRN